MLNPLLKGLASVPVPAASRRTHLRAAGVLWSAVGIGLLIAGAHWMLASGAHGLWIVFPGAIALGWFKARYVLARPARRTIRRIEERGDDRCIGGFLSWKSWLLALGMVLLGRGLRASPLPLLWRGAIYVAIGAALLLGSIPIWQHMRQR
jgi:hypothetical protein